MTVLSVNLNKVALLRNQRPLEIPSVVRAARVCVAAGAGGITVHPRPDERHIRRQDVRDLAALLAGDEFADVELNIEGNPFPDFLELIHEVRPDQCTLVPDDPAQATSDHGWPLLAEGSEKLSESAERIRPIIASLKQQGIRVSVFLDPEVEQVDAARELGTDRIELYTEPYARDFGTPEEAATLARYGAAAARASELGIGINAGHDLSLDNLPRFCEIPGILEVSIGHALTADALFMGLDAAVRAYRAALGQPA